jgi:hypothetical protein
MMLQPLASFFCNRAAAISAFRYGTLKSNAAAAVSFPFNNRMAAAAAAAQSHHNPCSSLSHLVVHERVLLDDCVNVTSSDAVANLAAAAAAAARTVCQEVNLAHNWQFLQNQQQRVRNGC